MVKRIVESSKMAGTIVTSSAHRRMAELLTSRGMACVTKSDPRFT
jgi:hypothetical protein